MARYHVLTALLLFCAFFAHVLHSNSFTSFVKGATTASSISVASGIPLEDPENSEEAPESVCSVDASHEGESVQRSDWAFADTCLAWVSDELHHGPSPQKSVVPVPPPEA